MSVINGFDVESFINAIATVLKNAFPDYAVYDDAIPQNGYEDCFHVRAVNVSQKRRMGTTYKRDYDFDIAFFPADDSINEFYKWSEEMLQRFDVLCVDDENSYHVKDKSIDRVDSIWHFTFSVSFFVRETVDTVVMEDLEIERNEARPRRRRSREGDVVNYG